MVTSLENFNDHQVPYSVVAYFCFNAVMYFYFPNGRTDNIYEKNYHLSAWAWWVNAAQKWKIDLEIQLYFLLHFVNYKP